MPEGTMWKARVMWKSLEYPLNFLLENPSASMCRMLASLKKTPKPNNKKNPSPKPQNKQVYAEKEIWTLPEQSLLWCNRTNPRLWLEFSDSDFHGAPGSPQVLDACSGCCGCWAPGAVCGATFCQPHCPQHSLGSSSMDSSPAAPSLSFGVQQLMF